VRDGLSILDQAIAHADLAAGDRGSEARVEAAQVRNMLGLSDRAAVRRLFGLLLAGDATAVLEEARSQYQLGVEPAATLAALLREVHLVTLAKIGSPPDAALPEEARGQIDGWAGELSFPMLHRLWQLLLKGHEEVRQASLPVECCDMALLRVLHGASMPDPGELARLLQQGGVPVSAPAVAPSVASEETPSASFPADFKALVKALDSASPNVAATLYDVMRVVEYQPPKLGYQLAGPVHQSFVTDLSDALVRLTATRWEIVETSGVAQPSLYEQEQATRAAEDGAILDSPLVKAALEAFPDAEVHVDGRTIHSPHEAEIRSLRA
jgi:DNA polymerase-3 subunit gamma/tau